MWRWVTVRAGDTRAGFAAWMAQALEVASSGREGPFVTTSSATGAILGSSRFLTLRPEHRGLEIGSTWLTRAAWGTGANTAAKLLMLEHAFERLGCMRVEFKTEATNERSRAVYVKMCAVIMSSSASVRAMKACRASRTVAGEPIALQDST